MKTLDFHEVRLRALFRAIGRVAGASALVAAAGCASDGLAVAGDPDVPDSVPPLWALVTRQDPLSQITAPL